MERDCGEYREAVPASAVGTVNVPACRVCEQDLEIAERGGDDVLICCGGQVNGYPSRFLYFATKRCLSVDDGDGECVEDSFTMMGRLRGLTTAAVCVNLACALASYCSFSFFKKKKTAKKRLF